MTREELTEKGLSDEQADFVLDAWEARERQWEESRPAVRFTAPLGEAALPTREDIISIPDRARRRAAIAEHINLFKGE